MEALGTFFVDDRIFFLCKRKISCFQFTSLYPELSMCTNKNKRSVNYWFETSKLPENNPKQDNSVENSLGKQLHPANTT